MDLSRFPRKKMEEFEHLELEYKQERQNMPGHTFLHFGMRMVLLDKEQMQDHSFLEGSQPSFKRLNF